MSRVLALSWQLLWQRTGVGIGALMEIPQNFGNWQEIINSTGEIPPRLLELIQQMLACGWVQVLRCWR